MTTIASFLLRCPHCGTAFVSTTWMSANSFMLWDNGRQSKSECDGYGYGASHEDFIELSPDDLVHDGRLGGGRLDLEDGFRKRTIRPAVAAGGSSPESWPRDEAHAVASPCTVGEETEMRAKGKKIRFEGGDGLSLDTAVVILGARDGLSGIGAEKQWLRSNHPDWKIEMQALLDKGGRYYDRFNCRAPDGTAAEIFFDITDFFGT